MGVLGRALLLAHARMCERIYTLINAQVVPVLQEG